MHSSQPHCLLAQSLVTALLHDVTQEVLMSSSASIKPFTSEAEFHTYIIAFVLLGLSVPMIILHT